MSKYKTEIKWGVIYIVAFLLWMVFEVLMGWHSTNIEMQPYLTNLFFIVAIGVYYIFMKSKRDNDFGGTMTWKQGFISGLIMTAVVVLLTPLAQYLVNTVISPDYFSTVIDYVDEHGMMERADAEAHFNTPNSVSYTHLTLPTTPYV